MAGDRDFLIWSAIFDMIFVYHLGEVCLAMAQLSYNPLPGIGKILEFQRFAAII